MQNYVHRGETLTVTAPNTVVTGQGVLAGNIFGIAVFSAASGASLEIVTWGVYDLAKDGSTFNPGDKVYWDNVNFVATSAPPASPSTTPGNREIGVADLCQASGVNAPGGLTGDPTVRVRLNVCSIGLVSSSDMDPGLLQKITVVLTAAQIEAMNGAPVNIIPAPLAGQVVVPDQFVIQTKPGGTNFTGGGAVTFQYHGTSINPHAGNLAAATVNSGTASVNVLAPPSAAYQPPAATGIDITNGTAAFATGNGTLVVTAYYSIITLG